MIAPLSPTRSLSLVQRLTARREGALFFHERRRAIRRRGAALVHRRLPRGARLLPRRHLLLAPAARGLPRVQAAARLRKRCLPARRGGTALLRRRLARLLAARARSCSSAARSRCSRSWLARRCAARAPPAPPPRSAPAPAPQALGLLPLRAQEVDVLLQGGQLLSAELRGDAPRRRPWGLSGRGAARGGGEETTSPTPRGDGEPGLRGCPGRGLRSPPRREPARDELQKTDASASNRKCRGASPAAVSLLLWRPSLCK